MAIILCPGCSREISEKVHSCPWCERFIGGGMAPREGTDEGESAGLRMLLPVGRSGWAIASGYLGLFSVMMIPAPLAIVTGIMAIREIKRNPKKHGMGRAVFGIVMGVLGSIALLFFGIAMMSEGARRR